MNATSLSWKAALRRWVLKHVEQAPLRFHFCARASHGKKCHGDKKFPEVQSVSSTGTVLSVLFFTLQGVNPASSEVSGRLCALMIIEVMLKHLQKESTVQYALPWLIHMVNHAWFPNLCYYPRKCPFRHPSIQNWILVGVSSVCQPNACTGSPFLLLRGVFATATSELRNLPAHFPVPLPCCDSRSWVV